MMRKLVLLVILLLSGSPLALTGDEGPATFEINWYTIDGGGGQSAGGNFTLTGTIGQPDANFGGAAGGIYGFVGGFWGGSIDFLFASGFEGIN